MRTMLYSTLNPVLVEGCCSFIWLLIVRACDEFSNLKRCVPLDLHSTIHLFVNDIPNCGFMSTYAKESFKYSRTPHTQPGSHNWNTK